MKVTVALTIGSPLDGASFATKLSEAFHGTGASGLRLELQDGERHAAYDFTACSDQDIKSWSYNMLENFRITPTAVKAFSSAPMLAMPKLDEQELAHVLLGLRLVQALEDEGNCDPSSVICSKEWRLASIAESVYQKALANGKIPLMHRDLIDDLCQKLNFDSGIDVTAQTTSLIASMSNTELAHVLLGLRLVQNLELFPQDGFRISAIPEEAVFEIIGDAELPTEEGFNFLMSNTSIEELASRVLSFNNQKPKVSVPPPADYWGADPDYPVEDWQYEIANNDTRRGYWEWVAAQKENP